MGQWTIYNVLVLGSVKSIKSVKTKANITRIKEGINAILVNDEDKMLMLQWYIAPG